MAHAWAITCNSPAMQTDIQYSMGYYTDIQYSMGYYTDIQYDYSILEKMCIHTVLGYCSIRDYSTSEYKHTDRQTALGYYNVADTHVDMQN